MIHTLDLPIEQLKIDRPGWLQFDLWAADDDPPIIEVDRRQVMTCPLCRAAMAAGSNECPNCGMEIDL